MANKALIPGTKQEHRFTVTHAEQKRFAEISGDFNPIHLDYDFAQQHGFSSPVVYGALLIAKLSKIIGMHLPGSKGLWSSISMNFRNPLLVDQPAILTVEITQTSEATRSLIMKVAVESGQKTIANGQAMATLFAKN